MNDLWKVILTKGRKPDTLTSEYQGLEFDELYASEDRKLAEEHYEGLGWTGGGIKGAVRLDGPDGLTVRQKTVGPKEDNSWTSWTWRVTISDGSEVTELDAVDDAAIIEDSYKTLCKDSSLHGVLSLVAPGGIISVQRTMGGKDHEPKIDRPAAKPWPKEKPEAPASFWKVILAKGREFIELYAGRDREIAEQHYEKYCEDRSLKGTVLLEDPEGEAVRQRMGFISDEERWGPGYRPEIVEKGGVNDNIFSTLAEAARYFEQHPDAEEYPAPSEQPTMPSKRTVPPKSDPGGAESGAAKSDPS